MKQLFGILALLLLFSVASGQTLSPLEYNKTQSIYIGTVDTVGASTRTLTAVRIDAATDFAVSAKTTHSGDSILVKYVLKNSVTGAVTAATTIDTTGGATAVRLGTVLLTTMLGYDQLYITLTTVAINATTDKITIFLTPVKRSGGFVGNIQGVVPALNVTKQFYYKSGYSSSTANETLSTYIPIQGITDIKVFARSSDSAVAVIYYLLNNSVTGVSGSWTSLGTATHVQTSDTTTSVGNILLSSLLGYNNIKFYVDYQAASTAEASRVFRLYYHFLRRE